MNPDEKNIAVTLRYPIHLEERKQRSKILPDSSKIKITFSRPNKAFVTIDSNCIEIEKDEVIEVVKSSNTFNLIKIKGMEETIKEKEKRRKAWFLKQNF